MLGWQTYDEGDKRIEWRLQRRRGAMEQRLYFHAYVMNSMWVVKTTNDDDDPVRDFTEHPRGDISVWAGFSSELVAEELRKLLPESASEVEAALAAGPYPVFFRRLEHIFAHARPLTAGWVESFDEVDAWIEEFCRWYAERGASPLDACRDLASLNRVLHTPWALREAHGWELPQMMATLALVHVCNDPAAPFMDWLGVVRRLRGGYPADPLLERLVERIRAQRGPNA